MELPFRRTKKLIDVSESEDESQEAAQELQLYKDDSKEVEDTDRYEQQNVPDNEHDENGTHPEEVALLKNETTASFRADLQRRSQKSLDRLTKGKLLRNQRKQRDCSAGA
eukprot:TRINITY_DN2553_c0_g1_i1.p1 TRINITY_DN2553_c0_g1~~TRINITY_DN2553_c0_g1_i1.p1  ORF type:complete len:110 (+),score=20.38 TRINITY_DN2553_c0_g1_i1:70-399(+)